MTDFRPQVLNQPLILRNFSADPVTNFEWTPTTFSSTAPTLRTLGVFVFTSATLQNDTLELAGSRHTLYKDKTGQQVQSDETPVVLRIVLNGADPAQVLPGLKPQLFFLSLQAAEAAIPLLYRQLLSLADEPPQNPPAPPNPECPAADSRFILPKVLYMAQPEFPKEARRKHLNRTVTILLTVNEQGRPSDLWLKVPAGLGLDEEAAHAASRYTFEPAKCDGTIVKTALLVAIKID